MDYSYRLLRCCRIGVSAYSAPRSRSHFRYPGDDGHLHRDPHFRSKRTLEAAFKRVQELDELMSRTRKGSDIYKVNQEAGRRWVEVSADTYQVIETALKFAELTGVFFDPTITPLVELLGNRHRQPSDTGPRGH